MRLLTIGSLPPEWGGQARGGVATFHAALLEGLLRRRDAVEVVGVVPPAPLERDVPVPAFARPDAVGTADFYEQLLERLEPDAVLMNHVAHTIGVTHARLRSPPPAVGVVHSWNNIAFRSGEERRRARETTNEALGGMAAAVLPSRHCLGEGEALGLGTPSLTTVVHPPLQPLYLSDDVDVRRGDRRGVICVGSLSEHRRPGALVEAAAQLDDLDVVVVGDGELEQALRASIERLGIGDRAHVTSLPGARHLERLRDLLLRSEVICQPSRRESFGIVLIEALACGTPVIGFGPAVREIRDTLGIDVGEPLDEEGSDEVAAAIERVRARRWDRDELRRRTVEAFGLERVTGRYLTLLECTAGRPAEAPGPARRPAEASSPAPQRPAPQRPARTARTAAPTVVCVLGMSRSGTSLTARMLGLAGAHLGPAEELLGKDLHQLDREGPRVLARAREANPEGFFEHYRMVRLNERILRSLGGSWRDPPRLEPGWEAAESLVEAQVEARALIDESFAGHGTWAWKDPRNSLTLPFWQRLLPDMRYVVCLRNPIDVAASLARRDGIEPDDAFALWLTYVASALMATAGRRRLLVSYERYFDDGVGTAKRLAAFAGLDPPAAGGDAELAMRKAIDERLWRNRTPPAAVMADPGLPADVASLHLCTELLCASAPELGDPRTRAAGPHAAVDAHARNLLAASRGELDSQRPHL